MYFPEQLIDTGINAPKEHQRIISKLTTGLGVLYYREKRIALEPLPETMIDEGQTSPVPDIQLYDNEKLNTPIIIEVAHANGARNDFKKVERLIEEYEYGILEGFVYNYTTGEWLKYSKGQGPVEEQPFWSDVLGLDLAALLA